MQNPEYLNPSESDNDKCVLKGKVAATARYAVSYTLSGVECDLLMLPKDDCWNELQFKGELLIVQEALETGENTFEAHEMGTIIKAMQYLAEDHENYILSAGPVGSRDHFYDGGDDRADFFSNATMASMILQYLDTQGNLETE